MAQERWLLKSFSQKPVVRMPPVTLSGVGGGGQSEQIFRGEEAPPQNKAQAPSVTCRAP